MLVVGRANKPNLIRVHGDLVNASTCTQIICALGIRHSYKDPIRLYIEYIIDYRYTHIDIIQVYRATGGKSLLNQEATSVSQYRVVSNTVN